MTDQLCIFNIWKKRIFLRLTLIEINEVSLFLMLLKFNLLVRMLHLKQTFEKKKNWLLILRDLLEEGCLKCRIGIAIE